MLLRFLSGQATAGDLLAWIIGAAIAITVHEYAHARSALAAGDNTPVAHGRVTLNPIAHYDPVGTTLLIAAGFGWAKPVPVNPLNFRRPRLDSLWVSLWGPLSNIILAALIAIPYRFLDLGAYTDAVRFIILINIVLAVFNLIPIPPLDGSHVLAALLPADKARKMEHFYARNSRWIMLVVLGVIFLPPFRDWFWLALMVPITLIFGLLTGSLPF